MTKLAPSWQSPQLATLVDEAPAGDDWLHEIKYDGYRLLAVADAAGDVRLLTRNRKDWTDRFPKVAEAVAALGAGPAILDGEVAVELEGGVTDFQALQNALKDRADGVLRFFVFDALFLSGGDLRALPLVERKALLESLLKKAVSPLRYSDHVRGHGDEFHRRACEHGLEGIISKRATSRYTSSRNTDWLKVKCGHEQEFVIGGFSEPSGSRAGLGALHVGAYDEKRRLVYRGKVGTGFTDAVLRDLRRRLDRMKRPDPPFTGAPRGAAVRDTHWVEPRLVAQVRFTGITADGRLRHPTYRGLREDKAAEEVVVERARSTAPASRAAGPGDPLQIEGVRLTSPGKVLYPEQGVTKLDLAEHYLRVAPLMLRHISARPLTLVRCPSGHQAQCFFQKHMDESAPAAIRRVQVEERDGPEWYGTLDSVDGLVSLVQLGVLELHTSNARADRLDRPDRFLMDLDPDEDLGWNDVVEAAFHVRDLLSELGLVSFVKTTGGKGLHVVVPLVRRAGWEEVKSVSGAVASLLAGAAPDRYTTTMAKKKRSGRILLDYFRNSEGATAIEAYSTRARAGAPVAVPITWDELAEGGIRSDSFTVQSLPARLDALEGDPWEDMTGVRQSITAPLKRRLGL